MKTIRTLRVRSRGIAPFQLLVVGAIVGLVGFAGWFAFGASDDVATDYHALSQADMFNIEPQPVQDFYSCLDLTGKFEPILPQTCMYKDTVHTRPKDFTTENVRNYDRLPTAAKSSVLSLARKNFDICSDVPETLSITRVLNVADGYVYLATGCDSGYSAVLVRQGVSWKEVNLGQGGLSCDIAEQYGIPRELVYHEDVPGSSKCYDADGKSRTL